MRRHISGREAMAIESDKRGPVKMGPLTARGASAVRPAVRQVKCMRIQARGMPKTWRERMTMNVQAAEAPTRSFPSRTHRPEAPL